MTNRSRSATALLFLVSLVTLTSPFDPSGSAEPTQYRTSLTFADRVAYQTAIEDVYWRHRIWPKDRPDPKPSFEAVMSRAQQQKKVEDYLRKSQALQEYWQKPISAEQLQAEIERMAKHGKQPEVLRELFEALDDDPFVIAECLARPALSERLLTTFYSHDQRFHGDLKRRAEADLRMLHSIGQMKQTSGTYSEIAFVRNDAGQIGDGAGRRVSLNSREWDQTVKMLAATFKAATQQSTRPPVAPYET